MYRTFEVNLSPAAGANMDIHWSISCAQMSWNIFQMRFWKKMDVQKKESCVGMGSFTIVEVKIKQGYADTANCLYP